MLVGVGGEEVGRSLGAAVAMVGKEGCETKESYEVGERAKNVLEFAQFFFLMYFFLLVSAFLV